MPTPEDRRANYRRFLKTSAVCHRGELGVGEAIAAQLMNVSATGAQLLMRGDFSADEAFIVALVNPRREMIVERRAVVCWKRSEGEGATRVGIQFQCPLTQTELEKL